MSTPARISGDGPHIQEPQGAPAALQPTAESLAVRFAIRLVDQGLGLTDAEIFRRVRESSLDQFESFLIRVNGLVTDTPISKRAIVESENQVNRQGGLTQGYVAPDGPHKHALLRHLHEECKKVDNAADLGMILFLSTQLIHPFPDGNGRTGRFFLAVLSAPEAQRQDFIRSRIVDWISHDPDDFGAGRKIAQGVIRPSCECFAMAANFLCESSYTSLGYGRVKHIDGGAAQMPGWMDRIQNRELTSSQLDVLTSHVLADHAEFHDGSNKTYVDLAFLRLAEEFARLHDYIRTDKKGTMTIDLQKALGEINGTEADRLIALLRDAHAETISTLIDSISRPLQFMTPDGRPFKDCYSFS